MRPLPRVPAKQRPCLCAACAPTEPKKVCLGCDESKPVIGFRRNRPGSHGLRPLCRVCEHRRTTAFKKARNKALIAAAKSPGCADCGATASDFDHLPERGPRLFKIGHGTYVSRSRLEAELAKCQPVCHACHVKRTNARRMAAKEDR